MKYSTKNRILRVFGRFYVFEEKQNAKDRKFQKIVIFIFFAFFKFF